MQLILTIQKFLGLGDIPSQIFTNFWGWEIFPAKYSQISREGWEYFPTLEISEYFATLL